MNKKRLVTLLNNLDSLLATVYEGRNLEATRRQIASECIHSQLIQFCELYQIPASADQLEQCIVKITAAEMDILENHCLYFGSMEIAPIIVAKRIKNNLLLQEKAICYIDRKLQMNNFKWIAHYDSNRGASFKTYITQYMHTRIIDFLKSEQKSDLIIDDNYDHLESSAIENQNHTGTWSNNPQTPYNDPANHLDQQHTTTVINEILQVDRLMNIDDRLKSNNKRGKLRHKLKLTQQEIAFLKALYVDDLNINQVRKLPGMDMSITQAYQFHDKLIEHITTAIREAGLLQELRDITVNETEKLEIFSHGESFKIAIDQVFYLQQATKNSTSCHVKQQNGEAKEGIIAESFSRLKKRLHSYFIPTDSKTLIAHMYIDTVYKLPQGSKFCAKLRNFEKTFIISKSYFKKYFEKYEN